MVTDTDLYDRYAKANDHAQDPALDDEFATRFATIERKLDKLWWRDTAEWIAGYCREAYRAWEADEREEPLCSCANPRCPWKQGEVPYQLRPRDTMLEVPDRTAMEELKRYLKTHPEAAIIDEALAELRELRAEVSDELVEYNRDAAQTLKDKGAWTDVPMAKQVANPPEVDTPEAGD